MPENVPQPNNAAAGANASQPAQGAPQQPQQAAAQPQQVAQQAQQPQQPQQAAQPQQATAATQATQKKKKKEEPQVVVARPRKSTKKSLLQSLNYIGLGKEKLAFVQNLATLLNAGLPLIDSLKTLYLESRVKPMKKLIRAVLESVESGTPLWRAMDDQRFFTPYVIALVRIGEEAGSLAENMEYLALQQEKDQALKSKVKMAMMYPSIVLFLVMVVIIGLGGFVLPNLIPVLHSLGGELPLITRIVIGISNFFTDQAHIAGPLLSSIVITLILLHNFTKFRVVTQWVIFHIPGIGQLAREATIARFGVILGGLLQAGVPLVEALTSMAEVTSTDSYKNFYFRLRDSINNGNSFQKSFKTLHVSQKILPISVQQLVVVGEQSGSLSKVLLKVADIYDKKATETAQKLPVVLEPILLLFVGALVGVIAFAIITPIYGVVGQVGR